MLAGIKQTLRSPYLLAISAYLVLYSLTSTFVYFEQAALVAAAERSRVGRAELLAGIELWVQGVTLVLQIFGTGRIMTRVGLGLTLALLPVLTGLGFLALAFAPVLGVLIGFQVVRKAANYALVKPARESLYAPLGADEKYRAKSFIDTFVYRGGDAAGAAFFGRLQAAGLGHGGGAVVGTALAALWAVVALHLGPPTARVWPCRRRRTCARIRAARRTRNPRRHRVVPWCLVFTRLAGEGANMTLSRRDFLRCTAVAGAAAGLGISLGCGSRTGTPPPRDQDQTAIAPGSPTASSSCSSWAARRSSAPTPSPPPGPAGMR